MTLNARYNKYSDLDHLRHSFKRRSLEPVRNRMSSIYQKKITIFGNRATLISWRKPKVFFSNENRSKIKLLQTERQMSSFNRARQMVYKIINCNIYDSVQKPTFWTYTFDPKEVSNINNIRIANSYFTSYIKELNRRMGFKALYLAVPEYQDNGNVHYHVVFFNLPFIEASYEVFLKYPSLHSKKVFDFSMDDIWKWGNTDVILLDHVSNISAYITKYMSKAFTREYGNRTYGEKLYFTSRGLNRPKEIMDEVAIDKFMKTANIKIEDVSQWEERGLRIINLTIKNYGEYSFD